MVRGEGGVGLGHVTEERGCIVERRHGGVGLEEGVVELEVGWGGVDEGVEEGFGVGEARGGE